MRCPKEEESRIPATASECEWVVKCEQEKASSHKMIIILDDKHKSDLKFLNKLSPESIFQFFPLFFLFLLIPLVSRPSMLIKWWREGIVVADWCTVYIMSLSVDCL